MNTQTPPVDRHERRKLETRSRIENAAYLLFSENGIEATSIEMICEAADVARRTFYSHFPNKQAVIGELGISRLYSQAEPMLAMLMEGHATTRQQLDGMIEYIETRFAAYQEVDRQLMISAPARFTSDPQQQGKISSDAIGAFARMIAAGQEKGDARTECSPEILATMIVGTLTTMTTNWAIDPTYPIFSKLEEARLLFQLIVCVDSPEPE
ncbi:TetR/AcrR family transcriptional regulator [Parahaliea maris]|uniref:TetR/AcrR family transcriptional regulator n=1 Tax=Parahaliea maris TaxID=2716870 RepID=A0A5C9A7U4_9GAMM|nr:TetR/AcrR family transcriptional regulator [Parahaliea maris]TXS96102.1 TetR/AcrR family transcriptional regulator [Parahaliea maris]